MFCNLNLTDMETCYKVFRADLLKSIPIRCNRFGFEPEITMKCAKRKLRIYEVPISYHGRTYEEGKKIGWKDGVKALGVILRFWLIDDLYAEPYGRAFLNNLTGTPQYLSWMTRVLRPHVGDTVLELGAGIGNIAARLMGRQAPLCGRRERSAVPARAPQPLPRTPNVSVRAPGSGTARRLSQSGARPSIRFLCLNVLEYVLDPGAVLESAASTLRPGASILILAPQSQALFGSLDRTLGHRRRFSRTELHALLEKRGFLVSRTYQLNKIGTPGWWVSARILRRKQISKIMLKLFDKTVWIWRRIDAVLPWPGLSLIVLAKKGENGFAISR